MSKIIIIRKDTLSNGGGKKKTTIDFSDILSKGDNDKNLRMYDSDVIIINRLNKPNPESLKFAFSSNLNSRLVSVLVTGEVNNPGVVKISRTSTLNDAILFSGGKTLTSGNISFLRIDNNGEIDSRKVSYNKKAKRGSYSNPYLKSNDLILVRESLYGKSISLLSTITRPFSEILSTYGIIKAIESL